MPERTIPKEIKIDDWRKLTFDGPAVKFNLEEDAWGFPPPPPRGVYSIKCFLARQGVQTFLADEKDPSTLFLTGNIEGRIVENEEYEDVPVFTTVNTRVFRGRDISTMVGFLVKIGASKWIKNPGTPLQIADVFERVLKKNEPVVKAEIDWRGSYQMRDDKTGQDIWVNACNKYEDFPQIVGSPLRNHIKNITGRDGLPKDVRAQVRITRFFAKGEALPNYDHGNVLVSAPKSAQIQSVVEPIPIFGVGGMMAPTQQVSQVQPLVQPINAGVVVTPLTAPTDEDLQMMLDT
jgi:hypothetical protein